MIIESISFVVCLKVFLLPLITGSYKFAERKVDKWREKTICHPCWWIKFPWNLVRNGICLEFLFVPYDFWWEMQIKWLEWYGIYDNSHLGCQIWHQRWCWCFLASTNCNWCIWNKLKQLPNYDFGILNDDGWTCSYTQKSES